ncbi:flagellar export chaperone FliS [Alkalihalophilus marmarensis]|uniref:Flagellar secretion chaperone FliS n=1 Tax=Alkalihalophilus marmarensis DSM 21297 TaxID=1188261 RepID=U6SW63_9BACI|nr:flagellar export chaperone FliS [Alkalihalophilus marmarensis]ERN54886.1 flagellar biosynthesis protein FliS [Alkalihalophilus marmarensis DSM 21297]MCM3488494.1 flagellar export chaperone FliS [Alkalihalophilus marmarensis]
MTTFLTNEALHQKSSQELTALLYEACLINLEDSLELIDQKEFVEANAKLQKASDIIHRLGAGINYEAGIIADQLEQVYNYAADKIVEANIKKDKAMIEEVIQIIQSIMSSWNEAMKSKKDIQPKMMKQKANAYESTAIYQD